MLSLELVRWCLEFKGGHECDRYFEGRSSKTYWLLKVRTKQVISDILRTIKINYQHHKKLKDLHKSWGYGMGTRGGKGRIEVNGCSSSRQVKAEEWIWGEKSVRNRNLSLISVEVITGVTNSDDIMGKRRLSENRGNLTFIYHFSYIRPWVWCFII